MCDQLRKIWTTSLGFILAVLMLGLNVSHSVDSHIAADHHKSHCDVPAGSETHADTHDDDHSSGQHSHAAIHHCHGANCYFLPNVSNPVVAPPVATEFVLNSTALLRLSFGIDGEEIDPPRV